MKSMILLTACVLVASSTYAADEKKVTVAKLEGGARVATTASKPSSKHAHSTPAVASESPVCDYSVETDCR